jgi:hypothetical protein
MPPLVRVLGEEMEVCSLEEQGWVEPFTRTVGRPRGAGPIVTLDSGSYNIDRLRSGAPPLPMRRSTTASPAPRTKRFDARPLSRISGGRPDVSGRQAVAPIRCADEM